MRYIKDNKSIGDFGEKIAIKFIKAKGYKILEENYSCKFGEIDIIAYNKDNIIFIEVKTRSSNDYGYPSESVTYYKQKKILKVALYYLKAYNLFDYNIRFDVIEVWQSNYTCDDINHIENAFQITY